MTSFNLRFVKTICSPLSTFRSIYSTRGSEYAEKRSAFPENRVSFCTIRHFVLHFPLAYHYYYYNNPRMFYAERKISFRKTNAFKRANAHKKWRASSAEVVKIVLPIYFAFSMSFSTYCKKRMFCNDQKVLQSHSIRRNSEKRSNDSKSPIQNSVNSDNRFFKY